MLLCALLCLIQHLLFVYTPTYHNEDACFILLAFYFERGFICRTIICHYGLKCLLSLIHPPSSQYPLLFLMFMTGILLLFGKRSSVLSLSHSCFFLCKFQSDFNWDFVLNSRKQSTQQVQKILLNIKTYTCKQILITGLFNFGLISALLEEIRATTLSIVPLVY